MILLGLSGPNGSGKDAVAAFLVKRHGYLFAGATEMLAAELQNRGLPTDRIHKSDLSAEWRRQSGMAAIVNKAVAMFEATGDKYQGLVVSSLRHPGEAERIHELGGQVVWIDADPQIRYQRIQSNMAARGARIEDNKTFKEFMADEAREMRPTGDAATLNMSAVKDLADITIINDGDDLTAFEREVEQALGFEYSSGMY